MDHSESPGDAVVHAGLCRSAAVFIAHYARYPPVRCRWYTIASRREMLDRSTGGYVVEPINIAEYEALAAERLAPMVWDYYRSGSDDEQTLRANHDAFGRIQLRPRVLVDVSQVRASNDGARHCGAHAAARRADGVSRVGASGGRV